MAANPEAIAWYVQRSEDMLERSRQRVQSFRTRGVQLAGFSGAVLALAGANAASILGALHGAPRYGAGMALLVGSLLLVAAFMTSLLPRPAFDPSGREIVNYVSTRFIEEPELWRVQVRTIRGLVLLIARTTNQGDEAASSINRAERLLAAGLLGVGVALVILVVTVTF
jgi:hypothetical protein